jgi:hypothetical protein
MGCLGMVRGELLIYEMSFSGKGPRVNYPNFLSGVAVIDSQAGNFSTILVLEDPLTGIPFYTSSLLSGSYFELLEDGGGDIYAVMEGDTGGDDLVESVAMQAIGETSRNVDVGPGTSLRVARRMKGFFLANSTETVVTDEDGNTDVETGFAGSSRVTARFDGSSTREANERRLDSAGAIIAISQNLERRGIRPEPTPSPSPSPTPEVSITAP